MHDKLIITNIVWCWILFIAYKRNSVTRYTRPLSQYYQETENIHSQNINIEQQMVTLTYMLRNTSYNLYSNKNIFSKIM